MEKLGSIKVETNGEFEDIKGKVIVASHPSLIDIVLLIGLIPNSLCLAKKELLKIKGVGPKVADCIMLFSMKKYEVFPIDVWIKRVMTELYFANFNKIEPNNKKILEFAEVKFGKLAGLAQQYLFYWRREL